MAPEFDSVLRNNDGTIAVKWKELTPDIAFGIVTNYTISYKNTDTENAKTKRQVASADSGLIVIGPDVRKVTLDMVDADSAYNVSMWASTSKGRGVESGVFQVKGNGDDATVCCNYSFWLAITIIINYGMGSP